MMVALAVWMPFSITTSGQDVNLDSCIAPQDADQGSSIDDLLSRADKAFQDDADFDETQLCQALRLYERVLELQPDQPHALNESAQGYFMLGIEYLSTKEERAESFRKGLFHGLARIGVKFPDNLDFLCAVSLPVIEKVQKEDGIAESDQSLAGLFWAANNWGRWIDNLSDAERISRGFNDLPCIQTSFEHSVDVDETYFAAGTHRALGSFLSQLPGGNLNDATTHFLRAIDLAPDFLENKVDYACGVAVRLPDRALFDQLIGEVLASPVSTDFIFWNKRAQRIAAQLKDQADQLFSSKQCAL
jgi:tetratricopeptide (TPR) repeat protein